ncbi:hypothetical protein SBOR_5875 [Sclerotinia borealis F-4128]|uniref:Uncharacterized protein n=1 Tax=Sclerotinia borealis (strain F-4128) TaxID=1432307 RepID=W9CD37_SCLBF|nr:hypothetical protein SBOR_5875 [Sclerotinia borealis F-4128]
MSSRTSFKPVEVQVIYGGCEHVLRKTQVIPIQVPTSQTPKSQKRNSASSNSSKSSRRNSWKSFLCNGAEQAEQESDHEADLEFQCQGLHLVDNIPGLCPDCKSRQDRMIAEQQARDAEFIRKQVAQEQDEERARQRRAYRHIEDRRTKFRCDKCIREDCNPVDRSANEGFCCEFGRSFWNAKQEAERISVPARQHRTPHTSAPTSSQVPTAAFKRMTVGTTQARQAATQAAKSYGWHSQPDELNRIQPELVSQFVSMPGNLPASLPGHPIPRYEDANIDVNRWNEQVRTNHGTYPKAAAPAPDRPLPPLPSSRKQRPEPLRLQQSTGRGEFRKEAPPSKRDSQVSAMSSARDMGNASPVSPTNSRWPSNPPRPRKREGEHALKTQISNLELEIDEALESWQQPQERTRRNRI